MNDDYRILNRASWDERAPAHAASSDYAVARFASDPDYLSDVVTFDSPTRAGRGASRRPSAMPHRDRHRLARAARRPHVRPRLFTRGPRREARLVASLARADVAFHEADVYLAADVLGREQFDSVFTGIGALCWLPDIRRWAEVVASLLRKGGTLFLREAHPMFFTLAEVGPDGRLVVEDPYFERP